MTAETIHVSNCPTCGHFPTQAIAGDVATYRALTLPPASDAAGRVGSWAELSEHWRADTEGVFRESTRSLSELLPAVAKHLLSLDSDNWMLAQEVQRAATLTQPGEVVAWIGDAAMRSLARRGIATVYATNLPDSGDNERPLTYADTRDAGEERRNVAAEWGEYLATDAERFLRACNTYSEVTDPGVEEDEGAVSEARETKADAWRALESSIYEFRKRAAKAAQPGRGES